MNTPGQATTLRFDAGDEERQAEAPSLSLSVVHTPDAQRSELRLSKEDALTVGRDVARGLCIADPRLSRSHLRIVWDPLLGLHRYADLHSANGTRVNGVPSAEGVLRANDVIRIGDTLLLCFDPGADRMPDLAQRAGSSSLPVLILGETGSGKERLARAVHDCSSRGGPFVAVNTAALPRELAASELFGHARGAFSGAGMPRAGLFRAADGGTLFLDEIGELAKDLQPILLRALENQTIRPVGSDAEVHVDVRIIAATNADIEVAAKSGLFREDLLARLAHLVLRLQPLRLRREQILPLVHEFSGGLELSSAAAEVVLLHDWPRNVRELRSTFESLRVLRPDARLIRLPELGLLLPEAIHRVKSGASDDGMKLPGASFREALMSALANNRGNVAAAARELGKPRSHVYRWLEHLGIRAEGFRKS
jgi:DNA-binding NtrC family response regulator